MAGAAGKKHASAVSVRTVKPVPVVARPARSCSLLPRRGDVPVGRRTPPRRHVSWPTCESAPTPVSLSASANCGRLLGLGASHFRAPSSRSSSRVPSRPPSDSAPRSLLSPVLASHSQSPPAPLSLTVSPRHRRRTSRHVRVQSTTRRLTFAQSALVAYAIRTGPVGWQSLAGCTASWSPEPGPTTVDAHRAGVDLD
eukprot:2003893-Prymnesium_polylepis.2